MLQCAAWSGLPRTSGTGVEEKPTAMKEWQSSEVKRRNWEKCAPLPPKLPWTTHKISARWSQRLPTWNITQPVQLYSQTLTASPCLASTTVCEQKFSIVQNFRLITATLDTPPQTMVNTLALYRGLEYMCINIYYIYKYILSVAFTTKVNRTPVICLRSI